jgi:hypothetical protein
MANDAEAYIAAAADACTAAGLIVTEYWSDDIDPRDGAINLVTEADADAEEDWEKSRTLGWDEERGWMFGEPKSHHGELQNLLWLCAGALPTPADVAEQARRIIAGELTREEYRALMGWTRWRDQEDDDGFEAELAAYREATTAAETENDYGSS